MILRDILHALRDLRNDLAAFRAHLDLRLDRNHERQNKMNADIQAALDQIAATKTVALSVEGAVTLMQGQLTDQAASIADLKAQLANGTPVTQADLDALKAGTADLADTVAGLTAAIPANTA